MSIEIAKGSEKQVAWAQDIRDQEVVNVEVKYAHLPESLMRDDGPLMSESFKLALRKLRGEAPSEVASTRLSDARTWINRGGVRVESNDVPSTIKFCDYGIFGILWEEAWRELREPMADEQAAWDAEEEVREAERAARRAKNRKPWQK